MVERPRHILFVVAAITIVALGMSLPDILGACMVTRAETHADEAMIHIAGSIAVKVLMGVGLPWFVAAVYHSLHVNIFFILLLVPAARNEWARGA